MVRQSALTRDAAVLYPSKINRIGHSDKYKAGAYGKAGVGRRLGPVAKNVAFMK